MPKFLDINKFCEDLKEVTTTKIMNRKRFHSEGLFSEQIFGPLKNYTCQCGTYYGISRSGGRCEICGVDIVHSNERRKRFAKISLPIAVLNPIFLDVLSEIAGKSLLGVLKDLMIHDNTFLFIDGDEVRTTSDRNSIPENTPYFEKLEAIYEAIRFTSDLLVREGPPELVSRWKIIYENLDKLLIKNVIVLPPDLRPAAKGVEKNNQVVDQINRYYMQILHQVEAMGNSVIDVYNDKRLFYEYFRYVQKDVSELYKHIIEKLSKKEGLIRGHILGKRIDFSGRGVIVPDPTLKLNQCSIPYLMFLELFKLQVAKKLIEYRKFKLLNDSIDFIDQCIEEKDISLFKICQEISKDEVCMLNRQPSLHRLNLIGFQVLISLDNVIKIHPLVCNGFNADFDGDQMAVYIPVSEQAKKEVVNKMFMSKNLINPTNLSLSTIPNQDIVLGIYMLTNDKFKNLKETRNYKGKEVSKSKILFNECLPNDYPLVDGPVDSKRLISILNDLVKNYKEETVIRVLDSIKELGFRYSTLYGATFSLDACNMKLDIQEIKKQIYSPEDARAQLNNVSSDETKKVLKDNFEYYYLVESGARGNFDQVRQVVLTRGFISNFSGDILPSPVKNSLLEGLDQKEFFNSTFGCRKGLLDVALNTGASGYLSRKLVFSCANLQLSNSLEDCGTKDYLQVYVNSEKKARMMMNKYYLKEDGSLDKITQNNFIDLVGKTILVRSPIFCKSYEVCKTCYGDLHDIIRSKYIGVIAAQGLGETNTQLVLRTFHTSGSAVTKKDQEDDTSMKQMDIVGDLSTASRLLHLSNENKEKKCTQLVEELFEVYNSSRSVHHAHIECVVSQMMWVGHSKWRVLQNRNKLAPEYNSVQTIPSLESWLLGIAFSEPKKNLVKGILSSDPYKGGILDKFLKGEKI